MIEVPKYTSDSWNSRKTFQLAIVIATFNRAKPLQKLLSQLRTELISVEDKVQVIISNNASDDNTDEVAYSFIDQSPELSVEYYVQDSNIGPNQNIFFVVEKARADYVWHISDDDLLVSGRVKSILELIADKYYPLILVRVAGHSQWETIPYDDNSAIYIESVNPFSQKGGGYLYASTFFAAVIFRLVCWRAVANDASRLFSTCYATWAAVLYIANTSEAIGIINAPCVLGNASMVAPPRIPLLEVLIMGRVRVWESLEPSPIKSNLKPYIFRLIKPNWRAMIGTNPPIIWKWNVIRACIDLLRRQIGIQVVSTFFFLFLSLFLALVMPIGLRKVFRSIIRYGKLPVEKQKVINHHLSNCTRRPSVK